MVLRKLSRQTLTDQAVQSLSEYIHENDLRPGDMLPSETMLADRFGVSRPVIREALKALEGRSVIEVINGRGAAIKPLETEDLRSFFSRAVRFHHKAIRELLEVRYGLEVQAASLAARRRTPEDVRQLGQVLRRMGSQFGERDAYSDSDLAFHVAIADATHNAIMVHLITSIRDSTRDSMYQWHLQQRTQEEYERVQRVHIAILEAVEAGDEDAAAAAMIRHFEDAIHDLERGAEPSEQPADPPQEPI